MGTALTAAQATEWYEFLKDLDNEWRARFKDLLSAAPIVVGTNAYTLKVFKDQDGLEDVELCIKDVAGFRVADVRIFLKYWKAHSGEVDVTNKPVMTGNILADHLHASSLLQLIFFPCMHSNGISMVVSWPGFASPPSLRSKPPLIRSGSLTLARCFLFRGILRLLSWHQRRASRRF